MSRCDFYLKEEILKKNTKPEVQKYWQEKEREIGEKIKGKDMSEYLSGYYGLTGRTWGLLYYTDTSFYFQTFPKKNWVTSLFRSGQNEYSGESINFKIPWSSVKEIYYPPKKNVFLSILSPPDYRVFIKYQLENKENTLVLIMYSRSNREDFLNCFKRFQHKI